MRNWSHHFRRISGYADFGADTVTVGDVQARLNALGASPPLTVDGLAGPATAKAVSAFQQSKGLQVDGKVGPQTLAALGFAGATSMVAGGASGAVPSSSSGIVTMVNSLVDKTVDFFLPVLKPAVTQAWFKFNVPNEGYCDFMYTDAKGLVTTGMGNLIEIQGQNAPSPDVYGLGWLHRGSGAPASQAEIDAAWHTVKSAYPSVTSAACKSLTDLYLPKDAITKLVLSKVKSNNDALAAMFPNMSSWPADAQMAIHSMAWAMGTGGVASFKRLVSALNSSPPDFATAASESHMQGVGIDQRNASNKQLFLNAADVQS